MDVLHDDDTCSCTAKVAVVDKAEKSKAVGEEIIEDAKTGVDDSASALLSLVSEGSTEVPPICWNNNWMDIKLCMDTDAGVSIYPFQDLRLWQDTLKQPLLTARQCIEEAEDWDLSEAVGKTMLQVDQLVDNGLKVLFAFATMAQKASSSMLPYLQEARAKGKKIRAANTCGAAQTSFVDLRKKAATSRSLYLELLEQVRYMIKCTRISIDFWVIKLTESESEEADPLDEHSYITTLYHANYVLGTALAALENCSDFWLLVHSSELKLESLKVMSANLRKELGNSRDRVWPTRWGSFVSAIEQFCDQYEPLYATGALPHFVAAS